MLPNVYLEQEMMRFDGCEDGGMAGGWGGGGRVTGRLRSATKVPCYANERKPRVVGREDVWLWKGVGGATKKWKEDIAS